MTPLLVTLRMKYRWKKITRMITGTALNIAPASTQCQCTPNSPWKDARPSGSVMFCGWRATMSGHWKAFHSPWKRRMARAARPGTRLALETDGAVELSALRPGHAPNTVVLRLANPSPAEASARARFMTPMRILRTTDLREGQDDLGANGLDVIRTAAPLEQLPDGRLEARLQPYEIGTWLLEREEIRT